MTITKKQKWEEKQLYGRFKRLINDISHEKTWTWLRNGNFKREKKTIQIATQNNAIKNNQFKARIDNTQQNCKCRLCSDRDETINYIISECSILGQKMYKSRRNRLGKVIHRDVCKKFKFDHTKKSYIPNPSRCPGERDTHKLL